MKLAGANFGYLYTEALDGALRSLAEHGVDTFELTPLPPHYFHATADPYEFARLRRTILAYGMSCSSVNPSFADLNLISTNPEFAALTSRQLAGLLELTTDLEAEVLVVSPGRRHMFAPVAADLAWEALGEQLTRLADRAGQLGVRIGLENSPYGFGDRAGELVSFVKSVDRPALGIVYDCANAHVDEDPADGVRDVAEHLVLAHVSDSWHHQRAHTHIGHGDLDIAAFAAALDDLGFGGVTVFELIVTTHPDEHLAEDLVHLERFGWQR